MKITSLSVQDIRFPTSRSLDGSDAMNAAPDYSAAYVVLHTDSPSSLQGHGLTDAAARLGNSVNTAKTHLRALFDKLECSRQADLVQTVVSHPVWLAGREAARTR